MTAVTFRRTGLTLEIERVIAAPRAVVWRCWTETDALKQWFCPKPWSVPEADFDLRPGGRMNTVMQGPNGERSDNKGIFLEIVTGERLVFTDAFTEGFVPSATSFMTGYVRFSDEGRGATRMVWGARHASEATLEHHLKMGFEPGWTAASDQLDELAQRITRDEASSSGAQLVFNAKARTCFFLQAHAEEAARFYVSLLPGSRIESVSKSDPKAPAMVVEFTVAGLPMMTLAGNPEPKSSHLMSISVLTDTQEETDRLWQALLADGGAEGQCGWLKDRFGVHWQIVPKALPRLINSGDGAATMRVVAALRQMKKLDIAGLQRAFTAK